MSILNPLDVYGGLGAGSGGSAFYKRAKYTGFAGSLTPAFGLTGGSAGLTALGYYRFTGSIVMTLVAGAEQTLVQVGWTHASVSYTDTLALLRSDGTTTSNAGSVANYTFVWFGAPDIGTGLQITTVCNGDTGTGNLLYDFDVILEGFIT